MKKSNTFYCRCFSEAKDKANIYYISAPAAREIKQIGKAFEIWTKTKQLAVFAYE